MSPEQVKALRADLGCTAKELAAALEVEPQTIFAWESGEQFPTKRYVERMTALGKLGKAAFPRKPKPAKGELTGLSRLDDPALWELVQKLLAHPALFREALKLAEGYPKPTD